MNKDVLPQRPFSTGRSCCRRMLSFRSRLVLGITGLHFVLMSALVLDLLNRQHLFLHRQGEAHASSLANTLAASSKSWVMANDVVGLQEVAASVAGEPGVRYVMVLSPDLRVLAHSDPQHIGQFVTDDVSRRLLTKVPAAVPLMRSHGLEDIAAPVMAGHKVIGWARVGIGQEQIWSNLRRGFLQGTLYIVVGSLVAYFFARLMANWLSSGLARLADGFARVGAGERGLRLDFNQQDEIGILARDFNLMVAELEAGEARLQELATTDFLTGLDNRRSFMEKMLLEVARFQRNQHASVAVLIMDLDHFKQVNDNYGHIAGDAVLRHLSGVINGCLRQADIAGRFGGEEFILLLPDTGLEGALAFAERLRHTVEHSEVDWEGRTIGVTISIGVTVLRAEDSATEVAIKRADAALYQAKENGRNRVEHLV